MDNAMYNDILYRIENTHRFLEAKDLLRYVSENQKEFTPEQLDNLEIQLEDLRHMFDPVDCTMVNQITLLHPEDPMLDRNIYGEKATSLCVRAKQAGMTLPDYMARIMNSPDFKIYLIHEQRAMGTGMSGFSRQISRSTAYSREASEMAKKAHEEFQSAREKSESDFDALRTEINELRSQVRQREPYSLDVYLTQEQFNILNTIVGGAMHVLIGQKGNIYQVRFTGERGEIDSEMEYIINTDKLEWEKRLRKLMAKGDKMTDEERNEATLIQNILRNNY